MNNLSAQKPYGILGKDCIKALANAFYDVMDERIEAAPIRAMHAENMTEIKQKLYEYLTGWMGGPPLYSDRYGSVCLTSAHKPYAIGTQERDQWLDCMDIALDRIAVQYTSDSKQLKTMLKQPLFSIADAVRNQD
jgi:hemoglobin